MFNDKLAILFDEANSFPVSDSDKQSRDVRWRSQCSADASPQREKHPREDDKPGCLSSTYRRSHADSNPFLKDFFWWFQDRQRAKRPK
jgi:hypothetical protein